MTNPSDLRRSWRLALGLAAGLATWACHSGLLGGNSAKGPSVSAARHVLDEGHRALRPPSERRRAPRLLPLVNRHDPSFLTIVHPGVAELVIDGVRLRLRANGTFDVASEYLPVARDTQVMTLPSRLGGGYLFALSSSDDSWLLRAASFLEPLTPIGVLDVPVRSIVPGFEGVYLTMIQTGLVLVVDPRTGLATETSVLPAAAEYGPIAIVDDWFGAYVDPLRGLLTSRDAGQTWHPFEPKRLGEHHPEARHTAASLPIGGLAVDARRLFVRLSNGRGFWLSRRGDVDWSDSRSPLGPSQRDIRPWYRRWSFGTLGGWPIELAVTRGAKLDDDTALVLARGTLAEVSTRDGSLRKTTPVNVAADKQCHALQSGVETYFMCQNATSTSLHTYSRAGQLERLGEFVGKRDLISVSSHGLMLRGDCRKADANRTGDFCVLRRHRNPWSVRYRHATGRERLVLTGPERITGFVPPTARANGRIFELGGNLAVAAVVDPKGASKSALRLLSEGFWLERPYFADGELGYWVTLGDELLGVRVELNGHMTLGEVISGASRAVFVGNRAIVPDSSGYALESLDGGLTYQRPHLPIDAATTQVQIPTQSQSYGCSFVGCQLGDWLRLGWSESTSRSAAPARDAIEAPAPLRMARTKRKIPRLLCDVDLTKASPPRVPLAPGVLGRRHATAPSQTEAMLPGTPSFSPFYGQTPPLLEGSSVGFDRGWRDERFSFRGYAQTTRQNAAMQIWRVELRVADPLRRESFWTTIGAEVAFGSIDSVARAFAHPRYGEHATSWTFRSDPDGDGALWSIDDSGKVRSFLLEPERPIQELMELDGRLPRRISDVARLRDGWYLLGTEPEPKLFVAAGGRTRVLSDFDPRARLHAARLRLLKNRDKTRVAYLVLSARLRSADVKWFVYPVNARTGGIEAPIQVPVERGLRACQSGEDGWVFDTSLDTVADLALYSEGQELSARTEAIVLLKESGLCLDRLLIRGTPPSSRPITQRHSRVRHEIAGVHLDETGRMRRTICQIDESAEN